MGCFFTFKTCFYNRSCQALLMSSFSHGQGENVYLFPRKINLLQGSCCWSQTENAILLLFLCHLVFREISAEVVWESALYALKLTGELQNPMPKCNPFFTAPLSFIYEVSLLRGFFHPKMKREIFFLAFYSVVGLGAFLSLFPGGFDFLWKHRINALSCSSS